MNQNIPSFYGNAVFKVTYLAYVDHPGFSAYHNRVKIGDATLHTTDNIQELLKTADPEMLKQGIITSEAIRKASRKRVKEWSGTADLPVKILLAGLNIKLSHDDNGCALYTGFRDYAIHDVLLRSGFKKRFITEGKKSGEWFDISHEDAIEAYKATLNGHTNFKSLRAEEIAAIIYRPEQKEAAAKAFRHFKNATVENPKKFLWNAIMRFGKTLTAYKLVKEMYQRDQKLVEQDKLDKDKAFKRVLTTHRPVVGTGWKDDSIKSFGYLSKLIGNSVPSAKTLEYPGKKLIKTSHPFTSAPFKTFADLLVLTQTMTTTLKPFTPRTKKCLTQNSP